MPPCEPEHENLLSLIATAPPMKSCFVRIKGLCIMRCKIAAIADLLFIIQILNISMAVFQVSQVSEYAELEYFGRRDIPSNPGN